MPCDRLFPDPKFDGQPVKVLLVRANYDALHALADRIRIELLRKVTATPAALSSKVANTRNFGSDRWSKTIRPFGNTWMKTLWFSWFLGRAHGS